MKSSDADSPTLSESDLRSIHRVACHYVYSVLHPPHIDATQQLGDLADYRVSGMYVTLKRGDTLRGCCGMQGPAIPLVSALSDSATRTTLHDPRMAPIAAAELPHLTLSVSVIGPPRPIQASGDDKISKIQIGQHGLRIRLGNHAGLLLPVVAKERDWDARQFLDAVCNKAGLPPGSWRREDARVEIFDGIDYSAPFQSESDVVAMEAPLLSRESLLRLRKWIQGNLVALSMGATPLFYATGVDDMTVAGVVLQITPPGANPSSGWMQLSVRDGVPLQASLFKLTEMAASALGSQGRAGEWQADLGVLSRTIHHGIDTDCQLQEVDPSRRAIVAMDGSQWSITFDQSRDVDQLVSTTLAAQSFRKGATMIYSTQCDATESSFSISAGPQPRIDVGSRPPAVAGSFYPANDQERDSMVDSMLHDLAGNDTEKVIPQTVAAIMVPHAGLRYSGVIAADVWRRADLPSRVLIVGPKHTRDGVDWAVSPHSAWRLSDSIAMKGDVELAQRIAENVPGMELDAAAHANEHGIEVQLPILYRVAPTTQVAAIAMAGGSIEQLEAAARSLADCLNSMHDPPLLVISSDMNHFADDEENRRRDRIALDQLAKVDPRGLLEVCERENISMCGQLPAALVLLTLQAMGKQAKFQEIAYGTSADTTGDKSRVVGYASVLF